MHRLLCVGDPSSEEAVEFAAIMANRPRQQILRASDREFASAALTLHPPDVMILLPPHTKEARTQRRRVLAGLRVGVEIVVVLPRLATEEDYALYPEAADVLAPPLRAVEVGARLDRVLLRLARRSQDATSAALVSRVTLDTIVGEAPAILALKEKLPLIARADATVLISGETGTGKEVLARAIHYVGPRAAAPFLPINCGAIPVELFENELFGHRRGAFTDAGAATTGVIAEADGGTVLFDEVDAIPLAAQVKLLQFLQSKTFRPLGGGAPRRADVRIIAATNTELAARVKAGKFREDLYYRLNIIPIAVPPLRERGADVGFLARHFVEKYARSGDRAAWRLSAAAVDALSAYPWPGNIRELENLVQQILALSEPGAINVDMLPARMAEGAARAAAGAFREAKASALAAFERDYATRVLAACGGNVTRAAAAAHKDRRAFGRLIKKYGLRAG